MNMLPNQDINFVINCKTSKHIMILLHGGSEEIRWLKIAKEEQKTIIQMTDLDQFYTILFWKV